MGSNKLILEKPARDFIESLPLGNGRLGACVYGEILREQIVLNESSMWSGSKEESDRIGAAEYLPEIRRLLRENKNYEAQKLFEEHFTCTGKGTYYAHGTDVPYGCYQVLGRLLISYFQAVSSGRQGYEEIKNYRRILDLEEAKSVVSFEQAGKKYQREYLVSHDYQAIFVHLTCSEKGQIDFSCGLDRDERFQVEALGENGLCIFENEKDDMSACRTVRNGLYMYGQLNEGYDTDKGVRYGCALTVKTKGGRIRQESLRVRVEEADEAWIILTARTDMEGFMGKESCVPREKALEDLEAACEDDWKNVLDKHKKWYKPQFSSMELSFSNESSELVSLYVQYARYLMICCSEENGFPANLQGIWADEILTPWNGDWHLNAQQMIYWLVERGNLSKNHIPYLRLTEELVEPGEKTAQAYYHARGWLAHTCTNPWGFTSPCEDASWGSTTGSPAWQCHHLWEHYLYTLDQEYLEKIYPVMKGAMLFYMDIMVENEEGYLVTSPSSSPENWFLDDEGRLCALCEGPAYDRELVIALTESCMQAGRILQKDASFVEELKSLRKKLAPVQIGEDGRIMEWGKEYKEPFPYHRHLSHLWGVFPGNLISKEKTPEYAEAAEKSLKMRGMTTAGWAIAYRACLFARLRNGEEAFSCWKEAMKYATAYNLMNLAYHYDETDPNPPLIDLENSRYPFQIDGNQGNAASILLMILDDELEFMEDGTFVSHLYLLPALPKELSTGHVKGIRGKGNLTIDMVWHDGKVMELSVKGPENVKVIVHEK